MSINNKYEPVICPRCGEYFMCYNSAHCWCAEVVLTNEVKEYIQENYTGCICSECLEVINKLVSKSLPIAL